MVNIPKAIGPSTQGKRIVRRFKHVEPSCCLRCRYSFKDARTLNSEGKAEKSLGDEDLPALCNFGFTMKQLTYGSWNDPNTPTPTPWESQLSIYSLPAPNPPLTALLVMLELDPLDISPLPGGTVWTFIMTALQEHSGRRGLVFLVLVLFPFFLFLQHIGHRLSEFSGILPGGYQDVLQSPSQLPGKYNTRWLGQCPSRTPEGGSRLVLSAPYGTSLLASGL